jgi:hypothetical protein
MKKIKLNNGFYATVDDKDYDFLIEFAKMVGSSWKVGHFNPKKAVVVVNNNLMHRIILKAPAGKFVTHINGDGLDNRKENLIMSGQGAVQSMAKGIRKHNKSGLRGVSKEKKCDKKKWRAELNYGGKRYRLGYFYDKVDAAKAWDAKAYELMGTAAPLNFPKENK